MALRTPRTPIPAGSGWNEMPDAKYSPDLYHYTSEAGFRGIAASNSLWATFFEDLNDSAEIKELKAPLITQLALSLVPVIKEVRKRGLRQDRAVSMLGGNIVAARAVARDWVNALYQVTFGGNDPSRLSDCYITSFCSHEADQQYERDNGLLSQWRGYGGVGGFCLVFDASKLRSMLEVERSAFFFVHLDMQPAHYLIGDKPALSVFPELLSESKKIVEAAISGRTDFGTEQMFHPFVTSATTTKHRGFYEEREVRIVSMPGTRFADERIKGLDGYKPMPLKIAFTTERDGRTRHHISLFGKDCEPLPIKRIIVGPSKDQHKNVEIAREIVGKTVEIVKSATPYVG